MSDGTDVSLLACPPELNVMSIRCSLTGHEWGDVRVETERDERDGEVAVTEREFRVCERCGDRRVVSENTEVRAFGEDTEDDGDDAETSTFAPSDEFETEETEDAAIIEGTLETSQHPSQEAEVETDADEDDEEMDDDELRDRVREVTGTEVTEASKEDTETDADYVCPDCGFGSSGVSLRAGDICPDCGGYIEEA